MNGHTFMFYRHTYKGRQFFDFQFLSHGDKIFKKVYSLRKEFAPRGANLFLEELISFLKGGIDKHGRVASSKNTPLYSEKYFLH